MIPRTSGFTLIEILVVMAIIFVLMGSLFVGINPTARINEAKEARAKTDVAQLSSSLEACITKNEGDETQCDTWSDLYAGSFVKLATQPALITISAGCVAESEAEGLYCQYRTSLGQIVCDQTSGC